MYTNQQHRPCIEFPYRPTTSGKITGTNLTPSQNENSVKTQLQVAEYADIYHRTYCFINIRTATYRKIYRVWSFYL